MPAEDLPREIKELTQSNQELRAKVRELGDQLAETRQLLGEKVLELHRLTSAAWSRAGPIKHRVGANHHYFAILVFSGYLCLISACAVPVLPLSPGTVDVANSTYGIVFGRIEILREGFDQMAYSFGKEFGWWMAQEKTGRRYAVRTLTRDGAFAVNLPAGRYRVTGLIYDEGAGVWEGKVPAEFDVTAGETTYLGTWRLRPNFQAEPAR